MAEYKVELDSYSGPLDLLLFLVRRHEVDLHHIPIAKLTEQYLEYVDQLEKVDVDQLSDFLVMAAMLLEIKSAMLSAGLGDSEDGSDSSDTDGISSELDPRFELIQQLLAYKQFKDAADDLHQRFDLWQQRYPARPKRKTSPSISADTESDETASEDQELDLEDANVLELCEAYIRVLESVGQTPSEHQITYDDTPIALHAEDIVDRLQRSGNMHLQDIFIGRSNRGEMVGLFLATLELVRNRRVVVTQDQIDGSIQLALCSEDGLPTILSETTPSWKDPETGEIDYDWPIESLRERAIKRAKRRAANKDKKQSTDEIDLDDEDMDIDDQGQSDIDMPSVEIIATKTSIQTSDPEKTTTA